MTIALGIDTGGTYTDAVLVDQENGAVLSSAKALTTHHDLSLGIERAVSSILGHTPSAGDAPSIAPEDVGMVGLSTTLATNAIVEGHGSPVCLILIGYDPGLIEQYSFGQDLVTDDVVYIRGGHDADGNQVEPLDEQRARRAIEERKGRVSAFAVSGYFAVRNRAHEVRVRTLIEELTDRWNLQHGTPLPVTCGHELTTRLNSVKRATTAALNARLIPLLADLIATVRRTLDSLGLRAPLMIVKGDGSLVRSEWALRRPIETILSGPAASVVGTWHLAGQRNVWVVDVGGTTTDIAVLRDGYPRVNPEGAEVGGWRTMVEAADVHTVGLGGDSFVRIDGNTMPGSGGLTIGPRRVVPLCLLAEQHPPIVDELRRQLDARERMRLSAQFALIHRRPDTLLSEGDVGLLGVLEREPKSLIWMADHLPHGPLVVRQLDELISRQLVRRSGFTPTDALHALGWYQKWNCEAARLGAALLATQMRMTPQELCQQVVAQVSDQVTTELVTKALMDESARPDWQREPAASALLARAIGSISASDLECRLSLRRPVVAVGAPVAAYLPRTADQLGTELIIPEHADVANAVGAVAGSVVQRVRALVRPLEAESFYRLYLPDSVHDFANLERAVDYAQAVAVPYVETLARKAGAEQVLVKIERADHTSPLDLEWGQEIFLETEITFTAVGRPSLVR